MIVTIFTITQGEDVLQSIEPQMPRKLKGHLSLQLIPHLSSVIGRAAAAMKSMEN